MQMICPNCQAHLTVPVPDREEPRVLPWIILGVALLVGVVMLGLLVLAGLSFDTFANNHVALEAERAAAEAALVDAEMQRNLAAFQARAAIDRAFSDDKAPAPPVSRQVVDDVIAIYRALEADAATRQLDDDKKVDLVVERLTKRGNEPAKSDQSSAKP